MALRAEIDGFPSNDPQQPGLVLHDPTGISTAMLLIPPGLVAALALDPLPEDLAEAYLYLMKDQFVTGSILQSDGGRLLK